MANEVVLIFGTFNPVTNAHIGMGIAAKRALPEADIVYVPSSGRFLHSWKNLDVQNTLSDEDRVMLLRSAAANYGFGVETIEVDGTVDGRTYHTVQYFKNLGKKVIICMGMDKVPEFHIWYKGEELLRENRLLICTRSNTHIDDVATELVRQYRDHFTEIEMGEDTQNVSATQIREAYLNGTLEQVRDRMPEVVYEYLRNR